MIKNTDTDNQHVETDHEKLPSLGDRLVFARQQAGLTQEELAAKLFLSVKMVNEIETDSVPESANTLFIKGYVKSYCTYCNASFDEVFPLFKAQYQNNSTTIKMQSFSNRTQTNSHNSYLNWTTVLIVFVMSVFIAIWWWQLVEEQHQPSSELITSDAAVTSSPLWVDKASAESDNSLTSHIQASFVFKQDCWVKITDMTNAVIAIGIKKSGTSLEISGVAPLEVTLSAPLGVDIFYQQHKIDISSYILNDTAKFSLPLEH